MSPSTVCIVVRSVCFSIMLSLEIVLTGYFVVTSLLVISEPMWKRVGSLITE